MALVVVVAACDDPAATRVRSETDPLPPSVPRVVSLSVLATRFVVELGAGDRIVGVDAESAGLPGMAALPIVDLVAARSVAPDLVLVADLEGADPEAVLDLESTGIRLVEFAPHDLEDVGALSRGLGAQLAGAASAIRFERRFSRPLALVAEGSAPRERLRVVAVVDLDPLTLAGGHSFETDLIEIAGGSSVTHGGEESRIVMTQALWDQLAPDLVIVTTPAAASPLEKHTTRALIPERFRVEFFDFDRETFWLHEPEDDAERMRALIARVASSRIQRRSLRSSRRWHKRNSTRNTRFGLARVAGHPVPIPRH